MRNKVNLLFWRVKNMENHKGLAPIYCRITVDKVRAVFSTGIFVSEKAWDQPGKRIKGTSEKARFDNGRLTKIYEELLSLAFELEFKKKTVTAARLRELYLKGGKGNAPTLLECYDAIITQQRSLVGTAITKATLNNTIQRKNSCERFIKEYYGKQDVPLDEVTRATATDMEIYFKSKGYVQTHINKALMHLKRCLNYAHEHEYITRNPMQYIRYKKEDKKPITYLTPEELIGIEHCKLTDLSIQRTIDIFLFACETGLAYCDVMSLSENSYREIEGRKWIVGNRQKSSTEYAMPLTSRALAILEKHNFKLPVQANQTVNDNLKLIAIASGISKKLHFHMARKTKASTLLNAGVPEPTILKVMGWESSKDFRKRYGKLELLKVAEDMAKYEQSSNPTIHLKAV